MVSRSSQTLWCMSGSGGLQIHQAVMTTQLLPCAAATPAKAQKGRPWVSHQTLLDNDACWELD